jgi:hypothetical protein
LKLLVRSLRLLAAIVVAPLLAVLFYLAGLWALRGPLHNPGASPSGPEWEKFKDGLGAAPGFYAVLAVFCLLVVAVAVILRRRDTRSVVLIGAALGGLANLAICIALPSRTLSQTALGVAFSIVVGAVEALVLALLAGLPWRRDTPIAGSTSLNRES